MKRLILLVLAASLSSASAAKAKRPPGKSAHVKRAHRVVKRSQAYRKTKADIDKAVEDVFQGGGQKDSGYAEPAIDVSELEVKD